MSIVEVFASSAYGAANAAGFTQFVFVFDDKTVLQERFQTNSASVQELLALSDPAEFSKLVAITNKLSDSGDAASTQETYVLRGDVLTKVVFVLLPAAYSRHNTPARSHAVTNAVKGRKTAEGTVIYLFPAHEDRAYAQILGAGRAFNNYSLKSADIANPPSSTVHIVVQASEAIAVSAGHAVQGIRMTQELVDMPPNLLHPTSYVAYARKVAADLGVQITVIQGHELEERGFGGIWGVGKAAENLPALVILSYYPEGTTAGDTSAPSICLVGKGITYDTGGLSIKTPTTNMAGMKMDMAGSAAVLGAFATAVRTNAVTQPLHGLLCIAENSIAGNATRPDDVHTFLSGKTVEVNNTDAEGRLVLADGVFYAHKFLNARVIVDIATLTGAQLIATGRFYAAIYCSDEELEGLALRSGKHTGDLTFPVPYCPEFFRNEFRSTVADMKNSVADRSNAQVSCAGQFIGNHLEEYLARGGKWLHVDMAGPAMSGDRATGFGVALLADIAKRV